MPARRILHLAVLVSMVDSRRADCGDIDRIEKIWIEVGRTVLADWKGSADPSEWRDDDEY